MLLKAGVPETVPGLTVNRICGSGLQAVVTGCEQIQLGRAKTTLCGGMENMSQVPFVIRGAREGFRLGQNMVGEDLLFAALMDPYCGFFMAQTAENVAKDYAIGRAEQDEYALRSHQLGAAAVKAGKFAEEIVPVEVMRNGKVVDTVTTDDHIKPETTLEGLAALRPAFGKDGTVTAGNASGIVDGAAAVVVSTRATARREGLAASSPRSSTGRSPACRRASWASARCPRSRACAKRAGIKVSDIDLVEINEAFSAQYLGCEKLLKLDRDRVNVNGGAIALGHPLGATGTRILYTVARELKARGGKYGVASACIGGGQGIAVLIRASELSADGGGAARFVEVDSRRMVRLVPLRRGREPRRSADARAAAPGRHAARTPGLANLGKVDDGLWRSAQPTTEGFAVRRALGIRTVVNLRAERSRRRGARRRRGSRACRFRRGSGASARTTSWAFLAVATDPDAPPRPRPLRRGARPHRRLRGGVPDGRGGLDLDEARREMRAYGAMPWYVNLDRLLRRSTSRRWRPIACGAVSMRT